MYFCSKDYKWTRRSINLHFFFSFSFFSVGNAITTTTTTMLCLEFGIGQ